METCVAAHRECLNGPTPRTPRAVGASTDDCVHGGPDLDGRRAHRNKVAHALVHELLAQGHLCRAVARNLGWGLNTVLRYARTATCQDTLRGNRPRPSRLAPYELYLERRFAAGRTNIKRLHHELISQNAPGAYRVLRAYIAALRRAAAGAASSADGAARHRLAHSSARDPERGRACRAEGRPGPLP